MYYNDKEYEITGITATYTEDRENVLGICRLTYAEIECAEEISNEVKRGIETQIRNHFAEDEYHTEDDRWKEEARSDIQEYTGAEYVEVELE